MLLAIGVTVGRFTRRSPVLGAVRHLVLGGVAVAVVFGIGHVIGGGVTG
jgi:VIT1/CCC1 family predicted Fe2+/Mn2+ transporter